MSKLKRPKNLRGFILRPGDIDIVPDDTLKNRKRKRGRGQTNGKASQS